MTRRMIVPTIALFAVITARAGEPIYDFGAAMPIWPDVINSSTTYECGPGNKLEKLQIDLRRTNEVSSSIMGRIEVLQIRVDGDRVADQVVNGLQKTLSPLRLLRRLTITCLDDLWYFDVVGDLPYGETSQYGCTVVAYAGTFDKNAVRTSSELQTCDAR